VMSGERGSAILLLPTASPDGRTDAQTPVPMPMPRSCLPTAAAAVRAASSRVDAQLLACPSPSESWRVRS
jgi:hypothetical protein